MITLENVINPIFLKFSGRFAKRGHSLDLDLRYPNLAIDHPEKVSVPLTFYLSFIEKEGRHTRVTISSTRASVIIKDIETVLTPEQLGLFKTDAISASSRLGFGTKITIPLE